MAKVKMKMKASLSPMVLCALALLLVVFPTSSAATTLKCTAPVTGGSVHYVKDGANQDRCFSLITPPNATTPMPILFWFHGAGGNGGHCGEGMTSTLGALANAHGFALVCGEAKQYDAAQEKGGRKSPTFRRLRRPPRARRKRAARSW